MKIQIHQVLISLLIGITVGYGTAQWQAKQAFENRWKNGHAKQWMVDRLSKELRLTDDQKKKVQAIFEAKHPRMVALHEEVRPKFEALRNETHEELRKVLNSEQQKKFEELTAEREERRKNRMHGYKF